MSIWQFDFDFINVGYLTKPSWCKIAAVCSWFKPEFGSSKLKTTVSGIQISFVGILNDFIPWNSFGSHERLRSCHSYLWRVLKLYNWVIHLLLFLLALSIN